MADGSVALAAAACAGVALLYVLSLYMASGSRPRNHPTTIRRRMLACAAVSCVAWLPVYYWAQWKKVTVSTCCASRQRVASSAARSSWPLHSPDHSGPGPLLSCDTLRASLVQPGVPLAVLLGLRRPGLHTSGMPRTDLPVIASGHTCARPTSYMV